MAEEQGLSAIRSARAKLDVAVSLMVDAGWWRNEAGYLTDAALWIEKANEDLAEGLQPPVGGDVLATLRMMHDNRQGCVGHAQRAERRALAVVIEHLATGSR